MGDKVKVLRTFTNNEMGCPIRASSCDEDYVGEECEITAITPQGAYELNDNNGDYFPFFVLLKIDTPLHVRLNDEYSAELDEDGDYAEVGCQTFEFENIERLYKKMLALRNK